MSIQQELGLLRPIEIPGHEALINTVLTGSMMTKEGDRLLRPLGLTDAQFNILMLLKYQSESGRINQTQLGQMLLVNRSNVTGLVDRMEQAGWVERTAESGDRRVKMVQLTPSGRKLLERAEKAYYLRVDEIMGGLSANEVRQLCRLLERIRLQLKPINQAD
jgi:DNA-binding MarR family transcriptional regulator